MFYSIFKKMFGQITVGGLTATGTHGTLLTYSFIIGILLTIKKLQIFPLSKMVSQAQAKSKQLPQKKFFATFLNILLQNLTQFR